jgi:hypothetical protein
MGLINVAELMTDTDFCRTITRRRAGAATLANEGVETRTYADVSITAIVQPATGGDLESLPEGIALNDAIAVWTADDVRIGDDTGVESDVLVVDADSFRILKVDDWSGNGYKKVIAQRFQP